MIESIFGATPDAVTRTVSHQTTYTRPKKISEIIKIDMKGATYL